MRRMFWCAAVAVVALGCLGTGVLWAGEDDPPQEQPQEQPQGNLPQEGSPPAPAPAMKYGIRDVEILLRDTSRLRGEIVELTEITVTTEFGVLKVPLGEMRRLSHGNRLSRSEVKDVTEQIKALNSDDYNARQTAQQKIEAYGGRAFECMTQALATAPAESRVRLTQILKRIAAMGGQKPEIKDFVRTSQVEVRGRLDICKIPVKTRFGVVQVDFEDLDSMRWLAYGARRTQSVDAWKCVKGWVDTGIDANQNEILVITASGQLNCGGNPMPPEGSTAWGNTQPYLMGTLIARIGDGKEFKVGDGCKVVAGESGRVYVRAWVQANMTQPGQQSTYSGDLEITVASGSEADGISIKNQE